MPSINQIKASDGSGNASVATVQNSRSPGAATIIVDTVQGIPTEFFGSMGTPHTFQDPVTSETITVISEATSVDFQGRVDGGNIEIDAIAPGYTDLGSQVGDIIVIKPTTQWADNVADVLETSHNDDGSLKDDIVDRDNVAAGEVPVLRDIKYYTSDATWTKPAGMVGNGFAIVEVQAGGGGSGGADNSGSRAGAGGGGEYVCGKIPAGSLGSTVTVTVGAGGTAGAGTGGNGGTGGTSSFGSLATAIGGNGGEGNSAGTVGNSATGGTGGTVPSGGISIPGGDGISAGTARPGAGGSSRFAGNSVNNATASPGTAGKLYGGGASGAGANNTTDRDGAVGGAGIVIVKEYY